MKFNFRKFKRAFFLLLMLLGTSCAILGDEVSSMDFWESQRRGANGNLTKVDPQWFEEAHEAGLDIIRFNASWFVTDSKDFLIGDVDHFTGIPPGDLEILMDALDEAHENDLNIILTMFELPGRRCFNEVPKEENDYRLWQLEEYQQQAMDFWKELALNVKDHPAIVAYDILNEPHPELAHGHEEPDRAFQRWLRRTQGTSTDLNRFNRRMVAAIREVDPHTPIILEGYFYADPIGMPYLEVIDDPNVIYSFHNPAPWQFASGAANKGKYSYPDNMPLLNEWNSPAGPWTIENLKERLNPVFQFMEDNNLPSYRIIASEFWCERTVSGCDRYFEDLISLYKEQGWHWTFYGFREDMAWTGLDYEMGSQEVFPGYWDLVQNGNYREIQEDMRIANPIWDVLQRGLEGE